MELKNLSLSHATLRNEDLIPAFAKFLEKNFPTQYKELLSGYGNEVYEQIIECGDLGREETAYYLLDDLIDILNEIAPNNFYFGSHEGDASDFGFWEILEF